MAQCCFTTLIRQIKHIQAVLKPELPAIQKYLITKCRLLGKRVITATEML